MKKTTAKIIQISDIIQWNEKREIELSPKYQRNSVWNEKAKAYLIDTIIRGLPIPPIFIRQSVDVAAKKTFREIIDGQQRIRTILEYIVEEKFTIRKSYNKEYAGMRFSELDDEIKESMLEYEIIAEVVSEKDDEIIYDMFARLNSNNIILNRQEIRNAKYWGDYKVFIYHISSLYRSFFAKFKIINDKEFSRMKDAEFVTSLSILFTDGVREETPTFIDEIYRKYDNEFCIAEELEEKFAKIFSIIENIFNLIDGRIGYFQNKNFFYTLFAAIAHELYGLEHIEEQRHEQFNIQNIDENIYTLKNKIVDFLNTANDLESNDTLPDTDNLDNFKKFISYHKTRTTSKRERIERVSFMVKNFGELNHA